MGMGTGMCWSPLTHKGRASGGQGRMQAPTWSGAGLRMEASLPAEALAAATRLKSAWTLLGASQSPPTASRDWSST